MGRAKKVKRERERNRGKKVFSAERWWVVGTGVRGDEVNFIEETRGAAEFAAEKINHKGGSVEVKRLVYNGPAANWLPEGVE